jgi:Tfp pilus assembly protein PilF
MARQKVSDIASEIGEEMAARFERAVSLVNEGQYEEAKAELEAILASHPEHAKSYIQLGLVYCYTGLFHESIETLQKGVELDPENLDGRNKLALTYVMLGMNDEARAEFESVLKADPTNAVALKNIVYFQ